MKEDSLYGVINQKITRRSFIKWSAAIGATATASGLVMNSAIKKAGAVTAPSTLASPQTAATSKGGKVVEWVPTHCLMCHSWCGLAVGLDADGHICKIEGIGGQPASAPSRVKSGGAPLGASDLHAGNLRHSAAGNGKWGNPDDADRFPSVENGYLAYSLANKGRICAKGNNGMQHVYDPDRVKYPLKRRSGTDRGAGKWVKISWRQAYWEIACVIRELNGYTTAPDGSTPVQNYTGTLGTTGGTPRQKDLRHRFVLYIGRNESSSDFKFGTVNHIEHTSLCESSRHQSTLTLFGHHFPFPDLNSHSGIRRGSSNPNNSADFLLEFGGNPCETKIPHSSYAVRWGDRRRRGARIVVVDVRQSNSAAFADEWVAIHPGTDGALAMGILGEIFNRVGAATLEAELNNGHLGGASHDASTRRYTGIFRSETTAGSFNPSDGDGPGSQTITTPTKSLPQPTDSLEDELRTLFGNGVSDGNGSASTDPATWAAAICGIDAATVRYLAGACGGADVSSGAPAMSGSSWDLSSGPTYVSPSIDGYRGPAKHTNGTYSWKALRALMVIAGRYRVDGDGIFAGRTTGGTAWGRGNIEKPGGLIINGWGANDGGAINDYSVAAKLGGGGVSGTKISLASGVSAAKLPVNTYPYASNKWNGTHDAVTIDRWDYEKGRNKFGIGTQGVDQNVIPGIRASLGLHPYRVNETVNVNRDDTTGDVILPYGFRQTAFVASSSGATTIYVGPHAALANLVGGSATLYRDGGQSASAGTVSAVDVTNGTVTVSTDPGTRSIGDHLVVDIDPNNAPDKDFEVEALLLFKNAPGNTRANIKLAQELATAKDGSGNYKLKHIWSIDTFMGDFTRFADIVLPDTTYLERYDDKDWEIIGLKGHYMLRQPVMRQSMAKAIYDDSSKDLFLYESRPVNSISLELNNAAAGKTAGSTNGGYSSYDSTSEKWAANSSDEDYNPTKTGSEGKPWDVLGLGGIGAMAQAYRNKGAGMAGVMPSISGLPSGQDGKYAWFRVFGEFYDANQVIDEYTGFDSSFFGHGGWAKQNAPRTWLNDDLAVAGSPANWADTGKPATGPARGYTALEVFNKRMTQILEPGFDVYASGSMPSYMNASGYKFRGVPVYQRQVETTDSNYPINLTTYKLNVHTQSRTAANPRQNEIIGNNWAVMSPATASGAGIVNGDTVQVETAQGWVQLEAKVTTKIKDGIVAVSNSFGHEKKGQDPNTIGSTQSAGTTVYGDTDAFGRYTVKVGASEFNNRAVGAKASGGKDAYWDLHIAAKSDYTLGTPSAPGAGVHPNHAIQRTVRDESTSASLATDPVGTSLAWFDSKCKITKVT